MGCCSSVNTNAQQPAPRQVIVQPPPPQAAAVINTRSLSDRFRAGQLPDEIESADLANLINLLQDDNAQQPANAEEVKLNEISRAGTYLIEQSENESFEAMIRRLNQQKQAFFAKFKRFPNAKVEPSSKEERIKIAKEEIKALEIPFTQGCNVLEVDRHNILEDSLTKFLSMNQKKELKIIFKGETKDSGQDAGGLEKEWFNLICEEILNEDTGMLRQANTDEVSYVIDEAADTIDDSKKKFEFLGLVIAKAIMSEIPLKLWLNKLLFKLILNPDAEIILDDIEHFDTNIYHSLKYMQDNDINDDEYMEFYYVHEFDDEQYDLWPDGSEVKVTDDNKQEYIILKSEFIVKNFVSEQIESIRNGFEKLIPLTIFKNFDETEFSLLWQGESTIDIVEWKTNTLYTGDYDVSHYVIVWFWKFMDEQDQDGLRTIFQFVTGMSRLPAGGFSWLNKNRGDRQYFTIWSTEFDSQWPYPKAYTCFNRLILPKYNDENIMRESLQYIIDNDVKFGIGLED